MCEQSRFCHKQCDQTGCLATTSNTWATISKNWGNNI